MSSGVRDELDKLLCAYMESYTELRVLKTHLNTHLRNGFLNFQDARFEAPSLKLCKEQYEGREMLPSCTFSIEEKVDIYEGELYSPQFSLQHYIQAKIDNQSQSKQPRNISMPRSI